MTALEQRIVDAFKSNPGKTQREIAVLVGCSKGTVGHVALGMGPDGAYESRRQQDRRRRDAHARAGVDAPALPRPSRTRAAADKRIARIREMGAIGYTTRQIAAELRIREGHVYKLAAEHAIEIPADRVVKGTRRLDSTRIMEQTILAAETVTADVELIDLHSLDPAKLPAWIESLARSRRSLVAFTRRLVQEMKYAQTREPQEHAQAVEDLHGAARSDADAARVSDATGIPEVSR